MQSEIETDESDSYTLKINCKQKRTVRKANKKVNVEKNIIGLKICLITFNNSSKLPSVKRLFSIE